jgi:hypothetical protein
MEENDEEEQDPSIQCTNFSFITSFLLFVIPFIEVVVSIGMAV